MRIVDVYSIAATMLTLLGPLPFWWMGRKMQGGRHFGAAALATIMVMVLGALYLHSLVVSVIAIGTAKTAPAVVTAGFNGVIAVGIAGVFLKSRLRRR